MDPVNPLPGSSSRVTRPSASVDTPNHSPSAADVFQLALSVQPEPPERLEGRAIRPGPPLGGGLGGQARPETAGRRPAGAATICADGAIRPCRGYRAPVLRTPSNPSPSRTHRVGPTPAVAPRGRRVVEELEQAPVRAGETSQRACFSYFSLIYIYFAQVR